MHRISQPKEADPAGDLILVIGSGKDQESVLVSSRVLSLASPVLAAVSPRFAEGHSLADPISSEIPKISLPEDDPEALTWLCEALHFKKRVTEGWHKYDVSGALDPWSQLWMQKWNGSVDGVDRWPQMLWISYAFDNHESFWTASRALMRLYTTEQLEIISNKLTNGILPDRILDTIDGEREDNLQQLHTAVEDIISPVLDKECPQKGNHESGKQACDYLSRAGHYFQELRHLFLWPILGILHQTNLSTISTQLMPFKNYYLDEQKLHTDKNWHSQQNDHYSRCQSVQIDLKKLLKQATDNATLQQVSSKILSLASPVFGAMLGPRYAEGRALSDNTTSATVIIRFPEDNSEALLWLCEALHFQKDVSEEIAFTLLKDLAITCDKYGMSRALSSWSEAWMQKSWKGSIEAGGENEHEQILWISYTFGHHGAFRKSSRDIVRHYSEAQMELATVKLRDRVLPDSVLARLYYDREKSIRLLQWGIENSIESNLRHTCPAEEQHEVHEQSCEHLSKAGHYLHELSRLGLRPSFSVSRSSASNVSSKMLQFHNYDHSHPASYWLNGIKYIGCQGPIHNIKKCLETVMNDVFRMQQCHALCLSCVKSGRVSIFENCHAAEAKFCFGGRIHDTAATDLDGETHA